MKSAHLDPNHDAPTPRTASEAAGREGKRNRGSGRQKDPSASASHGTVVSTLGRLAFTTSTRRSLEMLVLGASSNTNALTPACKLKRKELQKPRTWKVGSRQSTPPCMRLGGGPPDACAAAW